MPFVISHTRAHLQFLRNYAFSNLLHFYHACALVYTVIRNKKKKIFLFFFFFLPACLSRLFSFFLSTFSSNQWIAVSSLKMENWLFNIRLSTNPSMLLPSPCLICVKPCHAHALFSCSRLSRLLTAPLPATAV